MNDRPEEPVLRQLLDEAELFDPASVGPSELPNRAGSSRLPEPSTPMEVANGVAVIDFLIEKGELDLGQYPAWNRVSIAFKNTYGDNGFDAWLKLSEAADNFDGDEACRKAWDSVKDLETGNKLTIASYIAEAKALGWKPPARADRSSKTAEGETGVGPGKGTDPAAYVIQLVEEACDEFWLDTEGNPHVSYMATVCGGQDVKRHAPVGGSIYKHVLAARYHQALGTKVLSNEQANLAATLLEYRARDSGLTQVAALRVGVLDGVTYVDLGTSDGRAVAVDGEGWRVIEQPPVRFVRGGRGALPTPERGGTLADFERHFNLSTDDLRRVLGFMIGAFNVGGSYAILLTDGEQGSGKSTLNDKIVALIDPPSQAKSARMSFNAKEQDLHLGALRIHVPYFDNVSTFDANAADALCRMSTGGGSGSRKLYTDDQYHEIVVIRPIIVTCIGTPTSRPDLLSRSMQITAQSLAGGHRTERAVMREFELDRAKMFGFLLTCVSAAIRNRDEIEMAVDRGEIHLPRLADFGEFVEGAAEHLGLDRGGFSALLTEGQTRSQTDSVLGTPLGAALVRHFSADREMILGSAREILQTLERPEGEGRFWPRPGGLKRVLQRIAVGLRALGIEFEVTPGGGHDNVEQYQIWTTDRFEQRAGRIHEREPF